VPNIILQFKSLFPEKNHLCKYPQCAENDFPPVATDPPRFDCFALAVKNSFDRLVICGCRWSLLYIIPPVQTGSPDKYPGEDFSGEKAMDEGLEVYLMCRFSRND